MYETKTHLFLVMEYVEGGELFDRIIERGCFSEKDAANIIRQILEAVKYLHTLGIVHRDLKPENVLCATKEALDVKIADFGLSKILDNDNKQVLQTCCGTPSYAAPELLLCEGYAEPVDIWAVGVILYTLLSGCLPFFGETHTELFERILAGAFSFPDPEWTNISESAKSLVTALLTANPKKRLTAEKALKHPWILDATGTQLNGLTERLDKIKISRKASTLRERYHAPTPQSVLGPQLFDAASADIKSHDNGGSSRPIDSSRSALVWEDERDWELMSRGTKLVKFSKDQFILKEGNVNRDFYRIKNGTVRVEKKRGDGPSVTLMKMGKNMMFGEISMLQSSGMITASVVADDETELYQVNVLQLKKLFETEHELAERFFRELALKQAQRLSQARQRIEEILERESLTTRKARENHARTQSFIQPNLNSRIAGFAKTFGLDEICFAAVPCRWKRTLLHAGMLYISEKNICATYSFFALKTKHVIPYTAITQLEGSNLELRFTWISNKKPLKASVMMQTEEDYKLVMDNVEHLWKEMRPRENSTTVLLTSSIQNPLVMSQNVTEVDQSLSDALTADDWKLILDKSKQYVFKKNQIVIREGDSSPQNLYQLAHGRCRVEQQRPEDDSVAILGVLQSGETFGEISFLQDSQITASVVADEDGVEVYVIEGDYLNDIFNEHPGIPGRFYKYLATLIANRLHHREIDILS
eukprot:TRINITY_DN229_c0_g1_i1.p1 TRINITY_DN229_c0_g1~~TRINITY_DN229_c0_g1_i1.p1  ORF type:complete len:795 (+),score=201.82 TRINITY_DN229_c0_g1_i1:271-2385(+)